MNKYKVNLDKFSDIQEFVTAVSGVEGKVLIKSGEDYCGNAKSIVNMLASLEWGDLYCESDKDIYMVIHKWIVD